MNGPSRYRDGVGFATITATAVRHGRRWRIFIRPANGPRVSRVVDTEADARALTQHFNRLGMAGVDLPKALAEGRTESSRVYPPLRDAVLTFLTEQVTLGNLRASTANAYRNRLATWAWPTLGAVPWNLITREEIGAALLAIRRAGKSLASVEQIRCPLARFYQWQIDVTKYRGANPAADLKVFIEKQPSTRQRNRRQLAWFTEAEAGVLLDACRELKPRWLAFLLVGFGGGLRWGEITGLARDDINWPRGRVHVQRTWSEDGGKFEPCKNGEDRWVKLPASALAALRAHLEAIDLEASVKGWEPAERVLMFPNSRNRVTRYGAFVEHVWTPLLKAAKLAHRGTHAMRHSYSAYMLEAGADLRWVKDQLGHASIEQTESVYSHLIRERHEQRVDLDSVLVSRPPASTGVHAAGAGDGLEAQLHDSMDGVEMVEGKGFVARPSRNPRHLRPTTLHRTAQDGTARPPASTDSTAARVGDGASQT